MILPKMIIFDYGNTLILDKGFDALKGMKAVMTYNKKNPYNVSPSDLAEMSNKMFNEMMQCGKKFNIEVHNLYCHKFIFDYYKLEFSITNLELEKVFLDNATSCEETPGIRDFIKFINKNKIRSGVISNISFTEDTLKYKINALIPENKFEFVITSSEYMYRKPNILIFELALRKSELMAEEVWYCGDNFKLDIEGASKAKIFPVLVNCSNNTKEDMPMNFEYLSINNWNELQKKITELL